MKTNLIKTFALVAALVGSSFAFAEDLGNWNVNDTVVIKKSTTHYLTGEEPSTWVYDKKHTIQQIGSKRFENGILLREIISWVGPDDITRPDGTSAQAEGANGKAAKANYAKADKANAADNQANASKAYSFGDWHVGDTVMVKPETKKYLTGEEPSEWVYGKKFTIQQLGTSTYPEGILIKEIISVVDANGIYRPYDQAQPAKQEEVKPQEEEKKEEVKPQEEEKKEEVKPQEEEKKEEVKPQEEEKKQEVKPQEEEKEEEVAKQHEKVRMQKHHRFSIGLRGGVASLMHNAPLMDNWKVGFDGILDLQYAYYFGAKEGKKVNHGIIVGLGVGYAQSPIRNGLNIDSTYNMGTYTVDYKINAQKVAERDGQIQIEVPLMYSLLTEKGFFLNVGPKFMMPVYTHYNQTISDEASIAATINDMGVTITNDPATGVIDMHSQKGQWGKGQAKINLMVTAELGWEWELKNGHALGVGVYGNYAPLNTYKHDPTLKNIVQVEADGTSNATVGYNSATDSYAKGMNYFDAGLKLVYHFQFPASKK